jgi:hypothetical protein
MNIFRGKGKGFEWRFVENRGWSNWGLQYQLGQVCQAGQVHTIRKQILSTCITLLTISNFAKISQKNRWSSYPQKTKTSETYLEIFMQNGKVGKGDIFSQENVFIALVA